MTDPYRSQAYRIDDEPSPRRTTSGWVALIVFAFLAAVGILGAVAVLSVYGSLASDLKPASELTKYTLPEETVLLDRTGEVELARFGEFKRDVVAFEDIPPIMLDATTAIEDKTFWENAGFDPVAIIAAGLDSLRGNSRGASTITQQLVRARLLDPELMQDPNRTIERKLKEIIQSIRVTQHFGAQGDEGKKAIITAYLNQIYYGNQSYGVKAAARSYFGKELAELTPGEAATLASLPKSPSNYDLVRNANESCDVEPEDDAPCPTANSHLIVPPDTVILQRRDQVLKLMAEDDRTPMSKDQFSDAELTADIGKELELARQTTPRWKAPHFVWAVRDELTLKLCGEDTASCEQLDNGGLRVTTTVDLDLQKIAEKWVKGAAIVPHRGNQAGAAKRLGFDEYLPWMRNLEDKNVQNGALVAVDYETGELVAYVGSAEYYASKSSPEFQHGQGSEVSALTMGLAIMALLSITAGTLYQKRFVAPCDVRSASAVQMAAALLVTLPFALMETQGIKWNAHSIGAMAWSVLALSLGGSSLLYMLIQRGTATAVTSLLYLVPPCTAVMAWLLFSEPITVVTLLGIGLTAAGVSLVVRSER